MDLSRRHLLVVGAGATLAAPLDTARGAAPAGEAPWALAVRNAPGDLGRRPLRLVHGRAPAGLAGTLYRNGPGQITRGHTRSHWFDGDGYVRAFRIGEGRADLTARFVDTPKRRADEAAGVMATPGFGTAGSAEARIAGPDDLNAANTSLLAVGEKLWALWEAGSPTAIDPRTLATEGFVSFGPDLKGTPFLAHPRVEPDGRVWNLGVFGSRAVVWRLSATGALEAATPIELPRAGYLHDFTATDRELILVLQPWVREGFATPVVDMLKWRPELGTLVVALDKTDLSRRRVWELPPVSFFHLGDAWEETDGTIRFDGCFGRDVRHVADDIGRISAGRSFRSTPARLALVSLGAGGRGRIDWTPTTAEFPQSDRRRAGRARRYTWHVGGTGSNLPRTLAVTDLRRERTESFGFGGGHVVEETLFVPRPGSTAEGDGWLVGTSVNLAARATELHAFVADRVADGPICTWRADVALPAGFHGTFVPA